jgi:hypothetical protein
MALVKIWPAFSVHLNARTEVGVALEGRRFLWSGSIAAGEDLLAKDVGVTAVLGMLAQ